MIRISVEVSRGDTRYRVMVKAESIKRALEIVQRQDSSCVTKVVFPIEPEEFFVGDATVAAEPLYRTNDNDVTNNTNCNVKEACKIG